MDENFVQKIKDDLLQQRDQIIQSLSSKNDEMRDLVSPVESGDEVDVGNDQVDRLLIDSLGQQDSIRLNQIEAALERIRTGKYGICIRCSKEIPEGRLEVLPYATMCIQCQAATERRNR